jgi:hypothetical protein
MSASGLQPALWLALLLSPVVRTEIPVGASRVVSVSAFDVLVVLSFLALCWPYRLTSLRDRAAGLKPLALFAALALGHSAAFLAFGHGIQLGGLVRETLKYAGFAANVAMLVVVFRTEPMDRAPSHAMLAATALVCGLGAMAFTWTPEFYLGGSYVTVIGAVLTTVAFLQIATSTEAETPSCIFLTGTTLAAALTGLGSIWSKFFLLCTASSALIFAARVGKWRFDIHPRRPWFAIGAGVLALALIGACLFALEAWRFQTSVSVRLNLWTMSAELAWAHFPWGLGLGQFGAWLASIHYEAGETQPIRFVHNQFLAFVTETGAVGVILSLIVLKLVADAAAAWTGVVRVLFVCTVVGSLTLHDGIGLRALQLLLGYSLAVAARSSAGGSQRHRFA